jgi:opacity protein-like surface antigen
MQRRWIAVGLALVFGALPAMAITPQIGAGAFAGASIPIVQDDNGPGPIFGVRVPVNLLRFLTVEPYFARTGGGEAEETFGGLTYTRSGFDINTFGVNAALGNLGLTPGFSFYPFAGIGSNAMSRDGSDDETKFGFQFGLGLGISPMPALAVNARGELNVVTTDETSRKFANVTLGLTYKFLGLAGAP